MNSSESQAQLSVYLGPKKRVVMAAEDVDLFLLEKRKWNKMECNVIFKNFGVFQRPKHRKATASRTAVSDLEHFF